MLVIRKMETGEKRANLT